MNTKRMKLKITALIAALAMVAMCFPVISYAAEANAAVTAAKNGVVQVNLTYRDDNNDNVILYQGTGFLINDDTVLTCAHVVELDDRANKKTKDNPDGLSDLELIAQQYGKKVAEVKDRLGYSVTINRDVYVTAKILQMSKEVDWAILKLDQSIQNKTPIAIRSSATVQQTESVYAIGFPFESALIQDINTYTSDDASITEGSVIKVSTGTNLYSNENAVYIQSNTKLTSGNSGGPMVDDNGYAVGICEGVTGSKDDDYFFSVAIDQVTDVLDALGVGYTVAGAEAADAVAENVEEPAVEEPSEPSEVVSADKTALASLIAGCEGLKADSYTEDSYSGLTRALNAAITVNNKDDASQEEVDAAAADLQRAKEGLAEKPLLDMMMIIIIAVIVAAVVIILIVVLMANKKKKAQAAARANAAPYGRPAGAPVPPRPNMQSGNQGMPVPPQGVPQSQGFRPSPARPAADTGETTVLQQEAGETTLLTREVKGGMLINVKTGERVTVSKEEFTIGRERSKVDYCVSGNSTVGRVHAKIVNRGGIAYLVDMRATNGTFLNGVKCTPMQEMPLKSGDKIILSDEEFTYQA